MALSELEISALVQRYTRERDRFDKMASTVTRALSSRLTDSAIPHVPTFRTKTPDSFGRKLSKDRDRHELRSFESEFSPGILDLAGVRILLYRPQDLEPTCQLVQEIYDLVAGDRFRRDHDKPNGYRARHRVVKLRPDHRATDPTLQNLLEVVCEIQIVTLVDHIWNELEHDIKYKAPTGPPTQEQTALLGTLRRQLAAVDHAVGLLMDATERQRIESSKLIGSADDLRIALAQRCGRILRGDLERCLDLLRDTRWAVTHTELAFLPLDPTDLDKAAERLAIAGCEVATDDIALVIAALWHRSAADFVAIANSWRGRRGPLSRALWALDDASKKGKI